MDITPEQAIKNFKELIQNQNLRILNLGEFQILIASLDVLEKKIKPKKKKE
jgi:hypothetical protein